jgi:hypothetical protein
LGALDLDAAQRRRDLGGRLGHQAIVHGEDTVDLVLELMRLDLGPGGSVS